MKSTEFTESSSQFLRKEDLGSRKVTATVERVGITEFDADKKLVLHFVGKTKALSLNRTNAKVMEMAFGDETDEWIGQTIELWVDPYVTFQGKMVGGIKITPKPAIPAPPPKASQQGTGGGSFDDDIPFAARTSLD